ncbi:MAG: hypothetical protein P8Q48_23025, partial [Paracoccaceae bacterium]|nr:hypothetical protein [Paracoccaceae bacterium]
MKIRFDQGLALGVLIGLLISILLFWMLQVWTLNVTETFFQLVTPLVSILAALLALSGIRSQVQSNFEIAENTRKAKLDAANATLPIVLSNICRVAENRIEAIINRQMR